MLMCMVAKSERPVATRTTCLRVMSSAAAVANPHPMCRRPSHRVTIIALSSSLAMSTIPMSLSEKIPMPHLMKTARVSMVRCMVVDKTATSAGALRSSSTMPRLVMNMSIPRLQSVWLALPTPCTSNGWPVATCMVQARVREPIRMSMASISTAIRQAR